MNTPTPTLADIYRAIRSGAIVCIIPSVAAVPALLAERDGFNKSLAAEASTMCCRPMPQFYFGENE